MSVFEKWSTAAANRDAAAMSGCLHAEYTFVRHQSGTTMSKAEMIEMFEGFSKSDAVVEHSRRCIYENDDILVIHSVVDFPDDTREAILSAYVKQDGKIIRGETGATLLAKA